MAHFPLRILLAGLGLTREVLPETFCSLILERGVYFNRKVVMEVYFSFNEKKKYMIENSPSWKDLHFHQKLRYVFEIVAICGGLFLLGVNIYQLRLLSQSNEINRQMFNSTFPLEIQSDLVDFVDENPLVIRLRLTSIVGRRMELHTLIPDSFDLVPKQ
jgi:hypothetical protein